MTPEFAVKAGICYIGVGLLLIKTGMDKKKQEQEQENIWKEAFNEPVESPAVDRSGDRNGWANVRDLRDKPAEPRANSRDRSARQVDRHEPEEGGGERGAGGAGGGDDCA